MRYFHFPIDRSHLIDGFDFGGKSSMDTQNSAVNQSPQRQIVECLIEVFPGSRTPILFDNLIIEAINLSDLPGFMITS